MLTVEPIVPLVGLKTIEGVTVKVAGAELTPSLAVTCLLPAESEVTLNVAEKPPVALAVSGKSVVLV